MTIKKGYHYLVDCDGPKCDQSYVVGTVRHNFDAKRQAKQKVIKEGWAMGEIGTVLCSKCKPQPEIKQDEPKGTRETEAAEEVVAV